jgi:hypothetical protein
MNNEPAFPALDHESNIGSLALAYKGLSKREYFAGLAMKGLLSDAKHPAINNKELYLKTWRKEVINASILLADELLAALSQSPTKE